MSGRLTPGGRGVLAERRRREAAVRAMEWGLDAPDALGLRVFVTCCAGDWIWWLDDPVDVAALGDGEDVIRMLPVASLEALDEALAALWAAYCGAKELTTWV